MNVVGIDGCRRGWFFVQLLDTARFKLGLAESLHELRNTIIAADLTLIDIPLGLKSSGKEERGCDLAARRLLGRRASSVFPVPCRQVLDCATYQEGSTVNHSITGRKLSRQSWGIMPKIAEADRLIRGLPKRSRPREMHPEVCFRALNQDQPMAENKKTPQGQAQRLALLKRHLPHTQAIVDQARARWLKKDLATDDILDALVGAVTASYPKDLVSLPAKTEKDELGLIMEIVFSRSIPKTPSPSGRGLG
jgi:predicted RNase H-like nuclease